MEEVEGMEGADCAAMAGDIREQAVVMLDKETGVVGWRTLLCMM